MEKRECTRASPLSNARVGQVGEEGVELQRGEHAFVDEGAGRQRHHIDAVQLVLHPLAQTEGEAVERQCIGDRHRAPPPAGRRAPPPPGGAGAWPAGPRPRAWRARWARRARPAHAGSPRRPARPSGARPWPRRRRRWGRKTMPGGVAPGPGQVDGQDPGQEAVGHLHQDPGPVTGGRLGPGGPPVGQVLEGGDGLAHEVVALAARAGRPRARCHRRRARTRGRTNPWWDSAWSSTGCSVVRARRGAG